MDTKISPHPRVAAFMATCEASDLRDVDVIREAGIHRSVWFRWKSGKFAPSLKNWDNVERTLERLRQGEAA